MSLFFFILSIITYSLGHFLARTAYPNQHPVFRNDEVFLFYGDNFESSLKNWMAQNTNLKFLEKSENYYLISESPRLTSFGSFYHIKIERNKNEIRVQILTQPKLVGSGTHQNIFCKNLIKNLELKNVG